MDVTESNFQEAVIDRSHAHPVVVDFWAAWCAPCRQLTPVLERETEKRSEALELVKLDVDANPGLSQTYGIRGIPAVKAFRDGRVVAEFVGAQPAAAVARFLDSLLPSQADVLAASGDEDSLRAALLEEPGHVDAAIQLARILQKREQRDDALEVLGKIHGSFMADGLAARLRLEQSANPDLSAAFAALDAGDRDRALGLLIDAIPRSGGARDEIRRMVVGILDELGVDDPLSVSSRSRLASALY